MAVFQNKLRMSFFLSPYSRCVSTSLGSKTYIATCSLLMYFYFFFSFFFLFFFFFLPFSFISFNFFFLKNCNRTNSSSTTTYVNIVHQICITYKLRGNILIQQYCRHKFCRTSIYFVEWSTAELIHNYLWYLMTLLQHALACMFICFSPDFSTLSTQRSKIRYKSLFLRNTIKNSSICWLETMNAHFQASSSECLWWPVKFYACVLL